MMNKRDLTMAATINGDMRNEFNAGLFPVPEVVCVSTPSCTQASIRTVSFHGNEESQGLRIIKEAMLKARYDLGGDSGYVPVSSPTCQQDELFGANQMDWEPYSLGDEWCDDDSTCNFPISLISTAESGRGNFDLEEMDDVTRSTEDMPISWVKFDPLLEEQSIYVVHEIDGTQSDLLRVDEDVNSTALWDTLDLDYALGQLTAAALAHEVNTTRFVEA